MKAQITLWPDELVARNQEGYCHIGHWDNDLDRIEIIGFAVDVMLASGVDCIEFRTENAPD